MLTFCPAALLASLSPSSYPAAPSGPCAEWQVVCNSDSLPFQSDPFHFLFFSHCCSWDFQDYVE